MVLGRVSERNGKRRKRGKAEELGRVCLSKQRDTAGSERDLYVEGRRTRREQSRRNRQEEKIKEKDWRI